MGGEDIIVVLTLLPNPLPLFLYRGAIIMMRRYSILKIKLENNLVGVQTPIRTANKNIVADKSTKKGYRFPIKAGYFYNSTIGLHGDQFDMNRNSNTYGQIKGNDNGDFFEWKNELLVKKDKGPYRGQRTFTTWRKKPVHLNHDDKYSCGFVADTIPNFEDKSIKMIMATSLNLEPDLCKSIERGAQKDVSMGCDLQWSICSSCGHISFDDNDWCNCLHNYKGGINPRTGRRVAEILKDVCGVELSHITVGQGADPDAKNEEVVFKPRLSRKATKEWIKEKEAYYRKILGIE